MELEEFPHRNSTGKCHYSFQLEQQSKNRSVQKYFTDGKITLTNKTGKAAVIKCRFFIGTVCFSHMFGYINDDIVQTERYQKDSK